MRGSLRGTMRLLRDETSLLECDVCSSLLDGLEAARRDFDSNLLADFGDEECLFLKIHLAAAFACRVEFGSTRAVGIPAADARCLATDCTGLCHMSRYTNRNN